MLDKSCLESPALTVYYDGACPVCSREIALYRRQPGAEACVWVDAATCAEPALGPGLTRSAALGRFHARRQNGELVGGMRGFAALWQVLPRSAWLGRLASFGPMPAMLEAAYRAFLTMRPLWRRAPGALSSAVSAQAAGPALDRHRAPAGDAAQQAAQHATATSTAGITTYCPEQPAAQRV